MARLRLLVRDPPSVDVYPVVFDRKVPARFHSFGRSHLGFGSVEATAREAACVGERTRVESVADAMVVRAPAPPDRGTHPPPERHLAFAWDRELGVAPPPQPGAGRGAADG